MTNRSVSALAALAVAALIGLTGCGSGTTAAGQSDTAQPGTAQPSAAPSAEAGGSGHGGHGGGAANGDLELWAVQTGPLGVVVTDGTGQLIYRFDRDGNAPSTSNCTGDCTATWQPLAADLAKPPELLGVDENTIGVVTRPDGTDQLTLAGWPLYRHLGTHTDEDTQANGTDGVWFAIRPDGAKAAAPAG